MTLPNPTITPIPNNEPEAVPSLWNTRYAEIDANFANLDGRATALEGEVSGARAGRPNLGAAISDIMTSLGILSGTVTGLASPASVQQAVSLDWLYRNRKIAFELFADGYRLRNIGEVAVTNGVMGDDSIDVADASGFRVGWDYLLKDGASIETVRIAAILSPTRLRLTSNLTRNYGATARIVGQTAPARDGGGISAQPGDRWISKVLNLGEDNETRAVVIRRSHNAATVRLYFRDAYTTAWTERPWIYKRVGAPDTPIPDGFADYEYTLPMKGEGFLRIVVEDEPCDILHIVGLGAVTGLSGLMNPGLAPAAPSISSPANGATNVGETPTLAIAAFSSPAGNAFAQAEFQVSTSNTFATVLHASGWVSAMSYTLPAGLLSTNTTYYVRARVKDSAGLLSAFGAASSLTTKTSFAYVNTPLVTSPSNGATDIPQTPTLYSSAFGATGGSDTHASSRWQIRLASGTWASPVHDSGETTTAKTSYQVPAGVLQAGQTQYVARVRHKGETLGWSEWSADVGFTTKQQFASIIGLMLATPGGGAGTWTRIDENFNAISNPGAAWFNNHPTYAGIVTQTIDGQQMVKIPKFYFRAGTVPSGPNAGKTYWQISDQPVSGFAVHPAFKTGASTEVDQIWVGKYQASYDGSSKAQSIAGVLPMVSMDFPTARARAYARNTGGVSGFRLWSVYDLSAIQMLASIEMGGADMQSLIGQGRVNQSSAANVDASDVAQATWRGIVGLWGNVWQMTDGLKTNGSTVQRWTYNVPGNSTTTDFATGYTTIPSLSAPNAGGYIVNFDAGMLANGIFWASSRDGTLTNGSAGDYTWQYSTSGDYIAYHGGDWGDGASAGLFCLHVYAAPSGAGSVIGARLAKV
ncbi:Ig-like domain-containing protein [Thiofaba sp. EF100]|uniref:Ig-like domain-containing protein n=1 Tax=Thiofaba sp. EF100 TaxID=3121274 RepID=UPI00322185D9